MKQCRICKEIKALSEFYRNSQMKDGHFSECRSCRAICHRAYYQEHQAEILARHRKYRKEHLAEAQVGHRKYYQEHRAEVLAQNRKYRQTLRGRVVNAASRSRYSEEHPERTRACAAVNYAVETGRLIKPKTCENCGEAKPLHGHHQDYSQPLVVVWLCRSCHRRLHTSTLEGAIA